MYTLLAFTLLCLFIHQTVAATLQDFTPRQTDLKGDCETIYTSTISGCQGSDFETSKCSTSCISGLESIGRSVQKSCVGQGTSNSIIAVFLKGQGVSNLCHNVASSAAATTSQSKTPTIGSSTLVLSSTSVDSTGIIADTSSASVRTITAESTQTVQPVEESAISVTSTVGTALAFASSTPASVLEATTATSASSSTKKAESTGASEGGSPFDTNVAATQAISSMTTLAFVALACLLTL